MTTITLLPPYSPDFSPIQNMWPKLKNSLRKFAARTVGEIFEALAISLSEINEDDLGGR